MKAADAESVHHALRYNLNRYRVRRIQEVALEGKDDGISGALLIALACRETWGRNIEGGAQLINGEWVPETRGEYMDVGCFQISRRYHSDALADMPGVKSGTWTPTIAGKTAANKGYCPRFEDSLQYTLRELHDSQATARREGVPDADLTRVAIAAHNAGRGGAITGYRQGDVDMFTTGSDYSGWVLACRTLVIRWLNQPRYSSWKVTA